MENGNFFILFNIVVVVDIVVSGVKNIKRNTIGEFLFFFFFGKKEVKHFDVKFLILYGNVVIQTIVHFLKWVTDGMMVMMKEM
jgi:hypothetical protein